MTGRDDHLGPAGLGVIVPALNTVLERDLPRLPLDDVSFYFTRIPFSAVTEKQLEEMQFAVQGAAELLATARGVRTVGLACTSGSFLKGEKYDENLIALMKQASKLECVTTSTSVVHALRLLGVRRPAIFTPYPEWVAHRCKSYLEVHDVRAAGLSFGFGTESTLQTDDMKPIEDWILRDTPQNADGVFISCTNFSWMRGISALESKIGLPVITSNQATVHGLLKAAGLNRKLGGYGQLLSV